MFLSSSHIMGQGRDVGERVAKPLWDEWEDPSINLLVVLETGLLWLCEMRTTCRTWRYKYYEQVRASRDNTMQREVNNGSATCLSLRPGLRGFGLCFGAEAMTTRPQMAR